MQIVTVFAWPGQAVSFSVLPKRKAATTVHARDLGRHLGMRQQEDMEDHFGGKTYSLCDELDVTDEG